MYRPADTATARPDLTAAVRSLPAMFTLRSSGEHVLGVVALGEWYVLVGPDVHDEDLDWVDGLLPEGDWTATFETFGQALITHFTVAD